MSKISKLGLFSLLICLISGLVLANAPELVFKEGIWTKEGDALIGAIGEDDYIASAYFTNSLADFSFEADVTMLDTINYSRWFGISYRSNEDLTLSHMLRVKQKTSLNNGYELSFLEDDRWKYQIKLSGTEFLELNKTYKIKVLASKDYFFFFLDDELIMAHKVPTQVAEGVIGLHTNGVTVKFENIVISDYPKEEMKKCEEQADWQAGRQRAAAFPTVPLIVAHRGNSSEAPENTLASVHSAILAGADGVEIDVYSTIDGEIILSHDSSLNRCTNGNGDVRFSTAEYLRTLDAGSKYSKKFAGEKMPFLREVLEEIKDKVLLVIEIKQYGIEDKILKLLDETGTRDQVAIISFIPESLARFHDIAPDVPTSVLSSTGSNPESIIALAKKAKTRSVDLSYGVCTKENVAYLVSRGYSVWAWTVDDIKTMESMVHNGVSVLTTNVPRKALDKFRPQ